MTSANSYIKEKMIAQAKELGFAGIGFASLDGENEHFAHYQAWLKKGYYADMDWIKSHQEMRQDPRLLLDGAKTIICLADPYLRDREQSGTPVARYAQGRDYHKVFKKRLMKLLKKSFGEQLAEIHFLIAVDSKPIMEHYWAERSGLGWIGKNSLLIHPAIGSYFFLGEIIIDLELSADKPWTTSHCGTCRACIEACPTKAIVKDGVIDANRCISWMTIEKKSNLTSEQKKAIGEHAFGCDICQEVCPWNEKELSQEESKKINFIKPGEYKHRSFPDLTRWEGDNQEQMVKDFAGTPLMRLSVEKLKENIQVVRKNISDRL